MEFCGLVGISDELRLWGVRRVTTKCLLVREIRRNDGIEEHFQQTKGRRRIVHARQLAPQTQKFVLFHPRGPAWCPGG